MTLTLAGEPRPQARIGVGIRLVDQLLDGGLRQGETLLVSGPPFSGKRYLLDHAAGAASDDTQIVLVCAAGPPGPAAARRAHLVDAYSGSGRPRPHHGAIAVNSPHAVDDVVATVEEFLIDRPEVPALILVDSLSVLAAAVSRETFFASFRRLVGIVRARGAAGLFALEPEAFGSTDLPVLTRLAGGVLRLAAEHDGQALSLERPDRPRTPWTEYTFGADHFDVTGSFNANRIR